MSAQLSDILPLITGQKKTNSFNFRDTLNNYLYHWPLFVLGIIVFVSGAFVYGQLSQPTYAITASVIINDQKKLPDEKEKLEQIDLSNTPKLAENEIEVFKSRNLISKVVNDLGLWMNYTQKTGLKTEELYKNSPVVFQLLNQTDSISKEVFHVIIKDNKRFFLKKSNDQLMEFSYGQVLESNFGQWKLEPNRNISDFKDAEITIELDNPDKTAAKYQKALDADLPNKLAPTIELTLKDEVEQRGKDILNHLIALYNSTTIDEKNRLNQRTLDFINRRISDLVVELNTSENAVQGYRSSKGLTNISSQSDVYLQNVQTNDQKLNEVNVQLNIIKEIEQGLNASSNDNQEVPATLGVVNDATLTKLFDNLAELESQRAKLLGGTPETSPIFDPINRDIKNTKRAINEDIQNLKTSLQAAKNQLEKINSKFENSIKNLPVQERELDDKTRQQTIKENLYVYLLQKKEEISLNYAATVADARIVDQAYADSPQSKKPLIYMAALMLGLIVPSGFIHLRQQAGNRITNRKEIEESTEMPILGELSHVKTSSGIISLEAGDVVIGEEFRALRTNLHYLNDDKSRGMVVLVTSSIASEGKSFVSSNLATVLAVGGNKTVILEMDLRRPKVSAAFGLSSDHAGITNHVEDRTPIDAIIQKSNIHPDLDVIGSGFLPSTPSEILDRQEIDVLIGHLRSRYKYIIIDTPPLNLVTDARILSRLADLTLYVVRQAFTYKSLLPFIKSLSQDQQFAKTKIIFNDVERGKYGYGQNYGNAYYQKLGNKAKSNNSIFHNFFKRF